MVFDYRVKHNGKYYEIGEDVPIGASSSVEKTEEKPVEEKAVKKASKKADK